VPSMLLAPGDTVAVREGSRTRSYFKELPAMAEDKNVLPWLGRELNALAGTVIRFPERSEIDGNLSEQLIVEYYSR